MSKRTFDEMLSDSKVTPQPTGCLLESGRWSDLVIECKGRVWKVHRNIVGLHSKPIAAAISGDFEEARTSIFKFDDHDPDIVGHMVDFIYSGDYIVPPPQPAAKPDSPPEEPLTSEILPPGSIFDSITTSPLDTVELDTSQELLIHTAVYIFAEEKDIPKLKVLAKEKYEKALPDGWNSGAFCDSLRRIYEETPESDHLLWDVAIGWAGKKAKELMDRGEFVELWREKADLGLAVFRSYLSSQASPASTATVASSTGSSVFTFSRTALSAYSRGICPGCHDNDDVVTSTRGDRRWWCKSCRRAFN